MRYGHDPQELLWRLVRISQIVDDPSYLPVEGDRRSRSPLEYHDAHRTGVDQRIQIGFGLLEGRISRSISHPSMGLCSGVWQPIKRGAGLDAAGAIVAALTGNSH